MRLIANKPCSFGGQQFFIGEEIPGELVVDAKAQEKLGVITIVNSDIGVSDDKSDTLFTQEQVDIIVKEALEKADEEFADRIAKVQKEHAAQLAELEGCVAELRVTEPGTYEGTVQIGVKSASDGNNEQQTAVPAAPEEIQQVFSIMQMNAMEGAEAIAGVKSENVLILLHAADSRKTIKDAAKKQVDNIFSISSSQNESVGGNATAGTNTEGADT